MGMTPARSMLGGVTLAAKAFVAHSPPVRSALGARIHLRNDHASHVPRGLSIERELYGLTVHPDTDPGCLHVLKARSEKPTAMQPRFPAHLTETSK